MRKRGELTTEQIITLIVLLVSFSVILFLIFQFNFGEVTQKEICHNSVVLKAKGKGVAGNLDCRTNYVCISGGEDCENSQFTEKIDIELGKNEEENKNKTMEAIAKEMADCWWMFGEGNLDYNNGGDKTVVCGICSIISFDEKIKELPSITYSDFYKFLSEQPKSNAQTYSQYLYQTNNALSTDKFDFLENPDDPLSLPGDDTPSLDYSNEEINFANQYSIIAGEKDIPGLNLKHRPIILVEKSSSKYDSIGCGQFITKA